MARPPQEGADASEQLRQVKGFGQIVISARIQARDAVTDLTACGEDKNRQNVAVGAQSARDIETVDIG